MNQSTIIEKEFVLRKTNLMKNHVIIKITKMFKDLTFDFNELSLSELMNYLTDGSNSKISFAAKRYNEIFVYIDINGYLYQLTYNTYSAKMASYSDLNQELGKIKAEKSVKFTNYKIKR